MAKLKPLNKRELEEVFIIRKPSGLSERYLGAEFRRNALEIGFPPYILSTEINVIFHYIGVVSKSYFVATLWNTGATIGEAISLRRKSFVLKFPHPYIKLVNLDIERNAQRKYFSRSIPLLSSNYIDQIRFQFATIALSDYSNSMSQEKNIWDVDESTARIWINNAVRSAKRDGVSFPVRVTAETIRNSYAMNMLILGVEPSVVAKLMGFKSTKWIDVYLKVRHLIDSL